MSNYTHTVAVAAIYKERREALDHHRQYFERVIAKLRELKMRQALGEAIVRDTYGDKKIAQVIATETSQLRYARDCVRRARHSLWEFNALQRKMRVLHMSARAYYAAKGAANKLQRQMVDKDAAIHRALSLLQTIVDEQPWTTRDVDNCMESLRAAICRQCAEGKPHTLETPHL